jgi:hypothetical protein
MAKLLKKLKGGSLSSTNVMEESGRIFVRKSVSLIENREYGYQRWYSQLKKIQRYSIMYPGLFPKLLDYGVIDKESYFDIEFYASAVNAYNYLKDCNSQKKVDIFFKALITAINTLHKNKFNTSVGSINLYIHEEVEQKLKDCNVEESFVNFIKNKKIIFNGVEVPSFVENFSCYKEMLKNSFKETNEIFTHGNMTLENILYIPDSNQIIFIDPYEENIIDSELAEYSQLLQSSNSHYEMYNESKAKILLNNISVEVSTPFGIGYFNELLLKYIDNKFNKDQVLVIRLLEISQFIRMLPFKMKVDKTKMIFFYGLASFLFNNIEEDIQNER